MTPKPNAVKSPGYENVHAKILKVVDVESEWNIALIPNSMHSNSTKLQYKPREIRSIGDKTYNNCVCLMYTRLGKLSEAVRGQIHYANMMVF